MKLVILYGPPAVGKLTVATELGRLTGFKLFHNHLTTDAVMSLFPHGSAAYTRLIKEVRTRLLEEAVREGLAGVIMTLAFSPKKTLVLGYIEAVENLGGEVCLVRLHCSEKSLHERVGRDSRKRHGKIVDSAQLEQKLLDIGEPFAPIPGRESLELSTDELAPGAAARLIEETYAL